MLSNFAKNVTKNQRVCRKSGNGVQNIGDISVMLVTKTDPFIAVPLLVKQFILFFAELIN